MTKPNAENIKSTLDFYHTRETEETEKIITRTQQLALQVKTITKLLNKKPDLGFRKRT